MVCIITIRVELEQILYILLHPEPLVPLVKEVEQLGLEEFHLDLEFLLFVDIVLEDGQPVLQVLYLVALGQQGDEVLSVEVVGGGVVFVRVSIHEGVPLFFRNLLILVYQLNRFNEILPRYLSLRIFQKNLVDFAC